MKPKKDTLVLIAGHNEFNIYRHTIDGRRLYEAYRGRKNKSGSNFVAESWNLTVLLKYLTKKSRIQ